MLINKSIVKPKLRLLKEIWWWVRSVIPANYKYIKYGKSFSTPQLDYGEYWDFRGPHQVTPRARIIGNLMESGGTVLDIGCGDGAALEFWTSNKNMKGVGIDIAPNAVKAATKRGVDATVGDITASDFCIDKKYDYIVLSEVLEHIPSPEIVLAKLKGFFRKAIFVTIPNSGYIIYRTQLLFGRFPCQWTWHPGEHLRFWTVNDFKLWSSDLGFNLISLYLS